MSLAESIGKPQKPVGNLNKANFPENCKIQDESLLKDKTFNIPELKELGINPDELFPCKFLGGELEGDLLFLFGGELDGDLLLLGGCVGLPFLQSFLINSRNNFSWK